MMPSETEKFCANCAMHNWKQADDKTILKPCHKSRTMPHAGCGKIMYCSRACKKEHWEKVHQHHCQYLGDPTKCPDSQHQVMSCLVCNTASRTCNGKIKMAVDKKRNPSSIYECFIKDMDFPPGLSSPHPFPVAGLEGDLLEKSIIVIQNIVYKLKQNPQVSKSCSADRDLEQIEQTLWSKRRQIWRHRKIFSHPQIVYMGLDLRQFEVILKSVTIKVSEGNKSKEVSELLKIINLVLQIVQVIDIYLRQDALQNPIDAMPEQFKDFAKLALDNKHKFKETAMEIIDSLSTQVVPYEDIIKKLCGGKKRQKCSFCGVKIEVSQHILAGLYDQKHSVVMFDALSIGTFCCTSQNCQKKASSLLHNFHKFSLSVDASRYVREGTRCDFCFQLGPVDKQHRCCNCLTVMYCSKTCHKADKENHKEKYCIEIEKKMKDDSSMRRQMSELTPAKSYDVLEAMCVFPFSPSDERHRFFDDMDEVLDAFKKQEDKPDPEVERDSSTV